MLQCNIDVLRSTKHGAIRFYLFCQCGRLAGCAGDEHRMRSSAESVGGDGVFGQKSWVSGGFDEAATDLKEQKKVLF